MKKLVFHHTGVLVDSIENSIIYYAAIFGQDSISMIFNIKSQNVKVCFVKNSNNTYLELVEPIGENSVVSKMLKKRVSYYHVAYKVDNIRSAIKLLENLNYKSLEPFKSEAFDGKTCVFLFSPDSHLIELIEE